MAQTTYGDGGFRGLASEASIGLYASSMSMNATEEIVEVLNHEGEVIGCSMGNEVCNISASGVTVAAGTGGQTLGSAMTAIGNSAIYGTDSNVTKFFIHSVSLERQNQAWETGSFEARGWLSALS